MTCAHTEGEFATVYKKPWTLSFDSTAAMWDEAPGTRNAKVRFECADCGKVATYNPNSDHTPKWFRDLWVKQCDRSQEEL
jgi:hypothetical protein